jgi:hypothetical protein
VILVGRIITWILAMRTNDRADEEARFTKVKADTTTVIRQAISIVQPMVSTHPGRFLTLPSVLNPSPSPVHSLFFMYSVDHFCRLVWEQKPTLVFFYCCYFFQKFEALLLSFVSFALDLNYATFAARLSFLSFY